MTDIGKFFGHAKKSAPLIASEQIHHDLCAGFFSSLVASYVAKAHGRKICMTLSGIFYLIGAALTTGAVPRHSGLGMLIVGRIMLGVGVGFANCVSFLP